ncbi:HET-domain-containing protein, partial [Polychaeton citri CBS 116435]
MRLLNVKSLKFAEFSDDESPPYAIASHRWVSGCEAKFQDVQDGRNRDQAGFKKVEAFASYIKQSALAVDWLWIDTCCINKDSAAEVSEAINLMFDWYRNAEVCIAYLADVEVEDDKSYFVKSKWFKRGWTLQELLAPHLVVFVTKSWQALHEFQSSQGWSVEERLRWMEGRQTTREEDMSYALYGIFGVTPGANYGERRDGARQRLL